LGSDAKRKTDFLVDRDELGHRLALQESILVHLLAGLYWIFCAASFASAIGSPDAASASVWAGVSSASGVLALSSFIAVLLNGTVSWPELPGFGAGAPFAGAGLKFVEATSDATLIPLIIRLSFLHPISVQAGILWVSQRR
jgi:hypothetical protein